MTKFHLFLISIFFAFKVTGQPMAVTKPDDLFGNWIVTVQGEQRQRLWTVYGVQKITENKYKVISDYGWLDAKPAGVEANLKNENGMLQLEIKTPASATINLKPTEAGLMGTFQTSSNVKNVTFLFKNINLSSIELADEYANEKSSSTLVKETSETRPDGMLHAMTPTSIPGGKTVTTKELRDLLIIDKTTVLVNVLPQSSRNLMTVILNGIYLPSAGFGSSDGVKIDKIGIAYSKIANDKTTPIVFYCANYECWWSYNAALRAIKFGYKNVYWYRGGQSAWLAAKLPTRLVEPTTWE